MKVCVTCRLKMRSVENDFVVDEGGSTYYSRGFMYECPGCGHRFAIAEQICYKDEEPVQPGETVIELAEENNSKST